MSSILGISAFYHDSAACILIDGKIIAAAQEERFTIKKHHNQNSPFKNLLRPQEVGLATALSLVNKIDSLIDFTIKFDSKKRSFWELLNKK